MSASVIDVSPIASLASTNSLMLKRTIRIKAIVTPLWKKEMQEYLTIQMNALDEQLQQIEKSEYQAIASIKLPSDDPNTQRQVNLIQAEATKQRTELLDKKNQLLTDLQNLHLLEMESEIEQMQVEGLFHLREGENLISKLNVEVILRDGLVEEIRGDV